MRRFRYRYFWLVLLGAAPVCYFAWPEEPAYQGRKLSAWLEDLAEVGLHEYPNADQPRRAAAVAAVRSLGSDAVPWLLKWLRASSDRPSFRDKLQDVLDRQSLVTLHLPERTDRSALAVYGFHALGPTAIPALPELRKLLVDPGYTRGTLECLFGIGPEAVSTVIPALTNSHPNVQQAAVTYLVEFGPQIGLPALPLLMIAITNSAGQTQSQAMIGLGDFGPLAVEFRPWVESVMRTPGHPLAGAAMRVMAELSDQPEHYVPFFSERLGNTNLTEDAAFALAQVGGAGVLPLLAAATNDSMVVRQTALVALRTGASGADSVVRPPARRFSIRSASFHAQCQMARIKGNAGNAGMEAFSIGLWLAPVLGHPDPAVRLQVVDFLGHYGRFSALGLSRAAEDPDNQVRQAASKALAALDIEAKEGATIRGPKTKKEIALVFTGHEYAEGGETILDELARHRAEASFFVTGVFLTNGAFSPLLERLYSAGHYLGPHSDQHLLYCPWEGQKRTLVTKEQFDADFVENLNKLQRLGAASGPLPRYFLPPYEHYNADIVRWAGGFYHVTINLTPGTFSAADYTGEADANFVPSQNILDSIIAREQRDPNGLNGFILLFHLGAGPGRTDKFHSRLGEMLDYLMARGYRFVPVDELFDPQAAIVRRAWQKQAALRVDAVLRQDAAMQAFRKRYGLDR